MLEKVLETTKKYANNSYGTVSIVQNFQTFLHKFGKQSGALNFSILILHILVLSPIVFHHLLMHGTVLYLCRSNTSTFGAQILYANKHITVVSSH
jgi:hypothetical protein